MKIFIADRDVTSRVVTGSLRWRRYGAFRSSLSFTAECLFTDGFTFSAGMEVQIEDNYAQTVWRGVVTHATQSFRSFSRSCATVFCQGLEHILSRRVCGDLSYQNTTSGAIARDVFLRLLASTSPCGEGLLYNYALFDNGVSVNAYSTPGARLSQVFDDLAASFGGRWWIRADKTFYFMKDIPVIDATYCVDLTETAENRLEDVFSLAFTGEASEYRNIQTVLGADGARGEARNNAEIARMALLGGSGEYANITVNKRLTTDAACRNAAENLLRSSENETFCATFKTRTDGLSLFDRLTINAPQFGCAGPTPFIITQIDARDCRGEDGLFGFVYTVTAKKSSGEASYRPPDDWVDTFSQFTVKSDTTAQGQVSGNGEPLRAEDVHAGDNITLERSGRTVTVNAETDIDTVRLQSAVFSASGVSYTTTDGTQTAYTFAFDAQGRISSLTDTDGYIINISYE